ncbi:MAG: HAMP domain-containing protein, partial [Acidimicrobiales bacterium]
ITVEARGEVAELKDTINTMVDQLRAFADEVTRVAREVGTEGRLGGQAEVLGVSGTWKALTDNVNQLAGNLTGQVRNIAQVTTAVARGDLSSKITVEARGEVAELKDTINTMVDQLRAFADEVTRVAREVGTEGKLGGQATVPGVSGTWKDLTDNVNQLAGNLTGQVRNIAQVTTAVAKGDLTRKITVEVRGELLELKNTINTMVDQLSAFADEVTRVAREVGTEGKLGGQAEVKGVSGTWRDLTQSVNSMADNLTDQVRNIAQVTTAVAQGDLSQKITVDARGEILQLKNTINKMVDQLSAFASEVTRVAREVGTEGRLGGQAEVTGVSGTWKALTDNVNQLAGNLTTQVRSIADVATGVTRGDLTRTITVDAPGEVGELKDNINQMISNLRETTSRNEEQDWLKSNLARIGAVLQGHRDVDTVSRLIMSELTPLVGAQHGAFYVAEATNDGGTVFRLRAGYGFKARKGVATSYAEGEGLVGQAAVERKPILITNVPKGYVRIGSALGEAVPVNIVVFPVLFEERVLAVLELASLRPFSGVNQSFLEQIVETVGIVLNTILATMRTEELLKQSQTLTNELQKQQVELQHTNAEIELARRELEERAEQLALSSKYKSEFLANMSHELRTPLNSLLILAKLLADNPDGNLTERQVEFAASVRDAGNDLLALISDILDLSKVEAGKMDISFAPIRPDELCDELDQTFRPIAEQQRLTFTVARAANVPKTILTDAHRVQQILKNLLSNACKFTEKGSVVLSVKMLAPGGPYGSRQLRSAPGVVAFSVTDTGIGIDGEKLLVIFEAFQQADGTTSRRYGGTGLGLSISREIARLLGGEIQVSSEPGVGSTFTLLLPATTDAVDAPVVVGAGVAPEVANGHAASGPAVVRSNAEDIERVPFVASADTSAVLHGRTVLIVDDDVRNVYALTSALEDRGLEVLCAHNGRQGVELLRRNPGVDLVLMDIMMPEMDGYETTRTIRQLDGFRDLPIIALTAKAMRGDRDKSLAAGASDYITKPVEVDHLLEMMRVWLYR